MVTLLMTILFILCLVWFVSKGIRWMREKVWFRWVIIGGGCLLVIFIVLLFVGCPLFFEYFEYPRYGCWCWGPKNEKGEYTILYEKFGSKIRHLKGAGMLGYTKVGSFSKICRINPDGSGDKVLFENSGPDKKEPDSKGFALRDYCQKTNCILGLNCQGFWEVNLADKSKRLIMPNPQYRETYFAEFSPDGTKIAYISRPSGHGEKNIWLVDIKAGWRKWIGRSDNVTWHPSGKYIYGAGMRDLDGNMLSPDFPRGIASPSFSPDGNYIVGYCAMVRVKRMVVEGKEKWVGEKVPFGGGQSSKWSPDGRYIIEG
ncbi:MAG: hypothetical protein ABIJ30_10205, partial [bacterium]